MSDATANTQAPACHRCGADLGPGEERCFAIDTQAIEAALAEYDMPLDVDGFCPHGLIGGSGCSRCERLDHQVATWLCQLLADNARLTAALAEAKDSNTKYAILCEKATDAATGRAVARRLVDGWLPEQETIGEEVFDRWYLESGIDDPPDPSGTEPMTPAEATYLVSLSDEPT